MRKDPIQVARWRDILFLRRAPDKDNVTPDSPAQRFEFSSSMITRGSSIHEPLRSLIALDLHYGLKNQSCCLGTEPSIGRLLFCAQGGVKKYKMRSSCSGESSYGLALPTRKSVDRASWPEDCPRISPPRVFMTRSEPKPLDNPYLKPTFGHRHCSWHQLSYKIAVCINHESGCQAHRRLTFRHAETYWQPALPSLALERKTGGDAPFFMQI